MHREIQELTSEMPVDQAELFVHQLMESTLQALKQKCQVADHDHD